MEGGLLGDVLEGGAVGSADDEEGAAAGLHHLQGVGRGGSGEEETAVEVVNADVVAPEGDFGVDGVNAGLVGGAYKDVGAGVIAREEGHDGGMFGNFIGEEIKGELASFGGKFGSGEGEVGCMGSGKRQGDGLGEVVAFDGDFLGGADSAGRGGHLQQLMAGADERHIGAAP